MEDTEMKTPPKLPKQAETMRNADDFQQPIYGGGSIPSLETLENVKALLKMTDCKNLRDVNAAAKDWLNFDELLCGREDSRELQDHIVAARRKVYEECRAVFGADDEKTIDMMAETAFLLETLERYEEAARCGRISWLYAKENMEAWLGKQQSIFQPCWKICCVPER